LLNLFNEVREFAQNPMNKGVCHTAGLPFTLKKVSESKRRIIETQTFHHAKM
jgi:hypothetical protein